MATVLTDNQHYSDIADAIRAKGAVANVTVNKVKTYYAAGNGTVCLRKGGETETEGTLVVARARIAVEVVGRLVAERSRKKRLVGLVVRAAPDGRVVRNRCLAVVQHDAGRVLDAASRRIKGVRRQA